jgi:hemolysin activation/secretion protein
VSRGIEGFGRDEDVDLSTAVEVGVFLTPRAFGYSEDGFVPRVSARVGLGFRNGFLRMGGSALARITEAGRVDSGSVHVGSMAVLQPKTGHLAVLYAGHGWQRNAMPGAEFDLGLVVGPRGFGQHEFTGDRAFFTTAEYRYTVAESLLGSAGLGVAAFADYGGAWYAGSRRRTGYALGIGLRFGVTIDTGLEPLRVDLARVGGSGLIRGRWEVAIGKGFVFDSQTLRLDR